MSPVEVWVNNCLPQGQGLWVQQTWVCHKPSWRRSPLTPSHNCQNLHRTGDLGSWEAKGPCAHQDTGEKSSDQTWDWPRLARECPGSYGGVWVGGGLLQDLGRWVRKCMLGAFWRSLHYLHYLHHSLDSGQTTGRECSLAHQEKIGLKIYWASKQDPVSPSVSFSHQEASISLLSLSIRGQTEWKPQSQKQTKLITWTIALSNSMNLWSMLCRATQDGEVMVESSGKTWPTGEGNGKLLQYSCLENPMRSMKRPK